jgi:DNA-binding HxlR family transcriptional regulator
MRKMTSKNVHNLRLLVAECPFSRTLDMLGNRWRAVILWKLLKEARRFGALRRAISGITEKMLAQELRELERRNLIKRVVHTKQPLHVEYKVTLLGQSLEPILEMMFEWGEQKANIPVLPGQN